MQPYFFPYLGYYQMAAQVDHFIFLDDVQMIRRGYIQRNYILINGSTYRFTLPLQNASQNRSIHQHQLLNKNETFFKTLYTAYHQAPHFNKINNIIKNIFNKSSNLATCCASSIHEVFNYLQIPFRYSFSSSFPSTLKGQERIIELCKQFNAKLYYNPIGGKSIYDGEFFKKNNINLYFFHAEFPSYPQLTKPTTAFIPQLSMIDILMNSSIDEVQSMLKYGITEAA